MIPLAVYCELKLKQDQLRGDVSGAPYLNSTAVGARPPNSLRLSPVTFSRKISCHHIEKSLIFFAM